MLPKTNIPRQAKRPLFAYICAYCLVRDLTEQEALEELAIKAGTKEETLRACCYDADQFSQLPTGIALELCRLLEETISQVSITNKGKWDLIPKTIEVSDLELNVNKVNWFRQLTPTNRNFQKVKSQI